MQFTPELVRDLNPQDLSHLCIAINQLASTNFDNFADFHDVAVQFNRLKQAAWLAQDIARCALRDRSAGGAA